MSKEHPLLKLMIFIVCLGFLFPYSIIYGQNSFCKQPTVALIYTITTPELKEDVVREIKKELGNDINLISYEDPSIFEASREKGYVTASPAARLIGLYMKAIEDGADAILSICSTVADVSYAMEGASRYLGVPIVTINEEMCREAVRQGNRIAVMATFPTAIDPTKNILQRVSREMGKHIEIIDVLVENGFGLEQEQFKSLMALKANEVANQVDVIIFAQGSMAYCEKHVANVTHKLVLSNPEYGAKALKAALQAKGSIK